VALITGGHCRSHHASSPFDAFRRIILRERRSGSSNAPRSKKPAVQAAALSLDVTVARDVRRRLGDRGAALRAASICWRTSPAAVSIPSASRIRLGRVEASHRHQFEGHFLDVSRVWRRSLAETKKRTNSQYRVELGVTGSALRAPYFCLLKRTAHWFTKSFGFWSLPPAGFASKRRAPRSNRYAAGHGKENSRSTPATLVIRRIPARTHRPARRSPELYYFLTRRERGDYRAIGFIATAAWSSGKEKFTTMET